MNVITTKLFENTKIDQRTRTTLSERGAYVAQFLQPETALFNILNEAFCINANFALALS
jgi:hypothetical protein